MTIRNLTQLDGGCNSPIFAIFILLIIYMCLFAIICLWAYFIWELVEFNVWRVF